MGKNNRCAVWGCDSDHQYSDRYIIYFTYLPHLPHLPYIPHISKWDQSLQMRFFSPKNENEIKTWTKLVNTGFVDSSGKKKTFHMSKYTKIRSNHFEYGRPVEAAPNPTLFLLKGYDNDAKVCVKRKAPTSRKQPPAKKKILKKEAALETKNHNQRRSSCKKHHQIQSISHFLHFHQAEWKNQLVQSLLMFLCCLVKLEMWTLIYQKPKKVR